MGDDRALPRRIFHHLQAREARSPRYRCHSLLQIHPSQVDATGKKKNCFVGAERKMLHLSSTPRVAVVLSRRDREEEELFRRRREKNVTSILDPKSCRCSLSLRIYFVFNKMFLKEFLHFERFKKERIIVVKLKKIFSF